jgi:hypothetical protein
MSNKIENKEKIFILQSSRRTGKTERIELITHIEDPTQFEGYNELQKKSLSELNPEIRSMIHSIGNGQYEFEGREFSIDNNSD